MDAKLFRIAVFSACVSTVWVTASIVTPPSNTTAKKGDTVEFQCGTSTPGEAMSWSKYLPKPEIIYITGRVFNSTGKYQVLNNSALVINNVTAFDGFPYACLSMLDGQPHYANLVVVENLTAHVIRDNVTSSGDNVTLKCVLHYGGPLTSNSINALSPNQELQLSMILGSEDLTSQGIVEHRRGSDAHPFHNKTLSVNRNVTVADMDKELFCYAKSVSPFYEVSFNTTLAFRHSVTRVMISGGVATPADMAANETRDARMGQFYAGTQLNCSANGVPAPQVTWQAIGKNPDYQIVQSGPGYSILRLVGVGAYEWNCTASNAINGVPQAFRFMNFTVIEPPSASSKSNSVGLGVGLGIGLGVLVIAGIIVLIFVLRKQKYYGYHKQQKEKKPPIYNKTSPNFGTGEQPRPLSAEPLASRVLPPTNHNGVVMSPSPAAHETSRVSEDLSITGAPQQRSSHSPGHGDLGSRTVGASGSMPRLNESFDSAAERNFKGMPGVRKQPSLSASSHSSQGGRILPSRDNSYHIDASAPLKKNGQKNQLSSRRPRSDQGDDDFNTSV